MTDQNESVFVAIADSTRRQILETLASGKSRTATQLANQLPITRQGVTKHLQVLVRANLVRQRRSGRETIYTFNPQPLDVTTAWIDELAEQWDRRLQRLHTYLTDEEQSHDHD